MILGESINSLLDDLNPSSRAHRQSAMVKEKNVLPHSSTQEGGLGGGGRDGISWDSTVCAGKRSIIPIVAVSSCSIPVTRHGFGVKSAHHAKILTYTVENIPTDTQH